MVEAYFRSVPGTAATWSVLARGQRGAAFEERAESFDEVGRPVSEIEQGPFLELAVDPIALAQQNGRRELRRRFRSL